MPTDRVHYLGLRFDRLTLDQLLVRLRDVDVQTPYGYIVTPNVDHVVRLNDDKAGEPLAPLYERADLSLCDSRILRHLARLHGLDLPLVPGSDLTAAILQSVVRPGDRIALIGGDAPLVSELRRLYPDVSFLHHEPPMGLRRNAAARREAAEFIAAARARFTFIAVGSPQQEMIAAEVKELADATGIALCIGASLDFITGRERRAPRLLQRASLEWAYRLYADPRRMWRRYLIEGPRIFVLAARFGRKGEAR